MPNKSYLGDGVYVEQCAYTQMLLLTTENGIDVTNRIYLEPEVYEQLTKYMERRKKQDYKCLDCGVKLIYEKTTGVIINAWSRKSIDRSHLGFVCDACHNK